LPPDKCHGGCPDKAAVADFSMLLRTALLSVLLVSCSSLPDPRTPPAAGEAEARRLLEQSAARAGHPWRRLHEVEVAYDGQWARLVRRLQPVLVDAGFRQGSRERYWPAQGRVEQTHRGPRGVKRVVRTPDAVEVWFNDRSAATHDERAAAALVADGYTLFLFGSDWLLAHGCDWRLDPSAATLPVDGDPCRRVFGVLRPGLGFAYADRVVAWISERDLRLRRVQFTLEGLASTAGADVEVTFRDFQPGPRGTEFPRHFVETVQRPLKISAHDWRMTELRAR
jgi:hypothetical protein